MASSGSGIPSAPHDDGEGNSRAKKMRSVWKAVGALAIMGAFLVVCSRLIPIPCNRKVGEISGAGQLIRFSVPASENPLYRDGGYHVLLATAALGHPIAAEGRIIDGDGVDHRWRRGGS